MRVWFAVVVLSALSGSIGCAPPAPECGSSRTLDLAPEAPGTYDVGVRTWELTYTPPASDAPRTIRVYVWYPTHDLDRDSITYIGTFADTGSLVDATPAEPVDGCAYPVFAYSHGYQGFAGGSAFLMKHLASHGWVAVGVDHTGNTLTDNTEPLPTAHYIARPHDISAALDAVDAFPAEDPLSRADVSKVVLAGHSFGTYTTWAIGGATFDPDALATACQPGGGFQEGHCTEAQLAAFAGGFRDSRVVGVIPEAGSIRRNLFGPHGHESVDVPMMQLTGTKDHDGVADSWDSLAGVDTSWVQLAGACHETFNTGLFCDTFDRDEGWRIVGAYDLAFARRHVLGDTAADVTGLVDGTRSISDKVTYRKR